MNALYDKLADHVHLNVNLRPIRLLAKRDLLLCVLDEHDPEGPTRIVHNRQRQRRPVDGYVAFGDKVRE